MYPVGDDDLELLESYLDDALSETEVDELRHRLAGEPALAEALKLLRDERAGRQAYFQSIDPTPAEVDTLVGAIKHAATRRRWWNDPGRMLRIGGAMAACVVLGMLMGQLYRSNAGGAGPVTPGKVQSINVGNEQKFAVELTDDAGNVIAVQHFDNAREASDFAHDLRRAQQHRRQSNGVIMIGDEF